MAGSTGDLNLVTVHGTYEDFNGNPLAGTITFAPQVAGIEDPGSDLILLPKVFVATLDGSGHFSVDLPATDDPDVSPINWAYSVTENISTAGVKGRNSLLISVPVAYAGTGVSLADLIETSYTGQEIINIVSSTIVLETLASLDQTGPNAGKVDQAELPHDTLVLQVQPYSGGIDPPLSNLGQMATGQWGGTTIVARATSVRFRLETSGDFIGGGAMQFQLLVGKNGGQPTRLMVKGTSTAAVGEWQLDSQCTELLTPHSTAPASGAVIGEVGISEGVASTSHEFEVTGFTVGDTYTVQLISIWQSFLLAENSPRLNASVSYVSTAPDGKTVWFLWPAAPAIVPAIAGRRPAWISGNQADGLAPPPGQVAGQNYSLPSLALNAGVGPIDIHCARAISAIAPTLGITVNQLGQGFTSFCCNPKFVGDAQLVAGSNVVGTPATSVADVGRLVQGTGIPPLASTTVAAGSNGVDVTTFAGAGVLNVVSTAGFPAASATAPVTIRVLTLVSAGVSGYAQITYTGMTGTTLTGCTTVSGVGTLGTGYYVNFTPCIVSWLGYGVTLSAAPTVSGVGLWLPAYTVATKGAIGAQVTGGILDRGGTAAIVTCNGALFGYDANTVTTGFPGGTTTAAIAKGASVNTITVGGGLTSAIPANGTITVLTGIFELGFVSQTFVVPAGAAAGSTSVAVTAQNALANFPIGSRLLLSSTGGPFNLIAAGHTLGTLRQTNDGLAYAVVDVTANSIIFVSVATGAVLTTVALPPGNVQGSLTTALSTAGAITAIPITPQSQAQGAGPAIPSGSTITVAYGSHTQQFTTSAAVASGATSIPVTSTVPTFAFPAGSVITVGATAAVPGRMRAASDNSIWVAASATCVAYNIACATAGDWSTAALVPANAWDVAVQHGFTPGVFGTICDLIVNSRATCVWVGLTTGPAGLTGGLPCFSGFQYAGVSPSPANWYPVESLGGALSYFGVSNDVYEDIYFAGAIPAGATGRRFSQFMGGGYHIGDLAYVGSLELTAQGATLT